MAVIELERTNVMIILLVVIVKQGKSTLNHAMKKNVRPIGLSALSDHKKKVEQVSSKFFIEMELMVTARVNLKARNISYQTFFRAFNNPSAGRWGTICNDHYKYETGRVICRSVGFMNIQAKEGFRYCTFIGGPHIRI